MNYLPVFATHISPVLNPSGAADQHVGHFLPFHINHQKLGDSGVYSLLISTKHLVFFNREDFKSKKKSLLLATSTFEFSISFCCQTLDPRSSAFEVSTPPLTVCPVPC